ncbi:MAG: heat-inducible transcriptional repressor HrcA [Gammaproteobacteria bacterium]|nr:heat-inducible transcriptional repressor HrcA [Gammaproteobacteria bacterium]
MTLNARAEILLKTLIRRYISEGQPVGSRTLAKQAGLELSPATIRNVMADLEEMGLVSSPHTSAGRVPTELGYRVFVDTMLKVKPLTEEALGEMEEKLTSKHDPQQLLTVASDLLSQVTRFAGVVLVPRTGQVKFKQIEFLSLSPNRVLAILVTEDGRVQNRVIAGDRGYAQSELVQASNYFNRTYSGDSLSEVRRRLLGEIKRESDEMHSIVKTAVEMAQELFETDDSADEDLLVSGEANLLDFPELCQIEKLRQLFDTFQTKQDLLDLLDKSLKASGIQLFIGHESGYEALTECSIVTSSYEVDDQLIGTLGVIGPTRMSYEDVIPVVDVTARLLGSALSAKSGDRLQ